MTVYVTEAELIRNVAAVLVQVRQGAEVIIEQNSHAVAILKPHETKGRQISQVIAALEAQGADAVIDEDFAADVQAGIDAQRQPWNPTSWE